MFESAYFIKTKDTFTREFDREKSPCYIFRKRFSVQEIRNARLFVCGLGYAYYYLNGKKVSEDLFTAPVSDYNKTLWVNSYAVDSLLEVGENVLTVICGNGFFNEAFKTVWNNQDASWRDNPKFILSLENNGETVLVSDTSWKCAPYAPIVYNHLRSGEHFDSRLFDENFSRIDYADADWDNAMTDENPPAGIFRLCECQPIRECAEYAPINIRKTGERKYVFDMGQNMSGYIRLTVNQPAGDLLVIRYAETLHEDFSVDENFGARFYHDNSEYMTDKFICNGRKFVWSPRFAYHGFRYIEIDGIRDIDAVDVRGIFVHQDVRQLSGFHCSNDDLNELYRMGQMATLSNLFYMPTDCPTREKFGWMNDAQASVEQMLINYDVADLLRKWNIDIRDAMREDGSLPGIVPSHGWGYDWGNGPVSDGSLFEVPYKVYRYTGDASLLVGNLPYFDRYLSYLQTREEEDGMVHFGLNDWAPPRPTVVPHSFINTVLLIKFLRIAIVAAELAEHGELRNKFRTRLADTEALFRKNFLSNDGTCTIDEQTSVAMILYYGLYDDMEPLKAQLKRLIEERDFHHNCGMVGLRRLFIALNQCGLAEYAYRILVSRGYPSFMDWKDAGGTALFERWPMQESKNHHMYSDFMSWIMKTPVGINLTDLPGYQSVRICPVFLKDLDHCSGYTQTPYGKISVAWRRRDDAVVLDVEIPEGITAYCDYAEGQLAVGRTCLEIPQP